MKLAKRLKIIEIFAFSPNKPEWMVIKNTFPMKKPFPKIFINVFFIKTRLQAMPSNLEKTIENRFGNFKRLIFSSNSSMIFFPRFFQIRTIKDLARIEKAFEKSGWERRNGSCDHKSSRSFGKILWKNSKRFGNDARFKEIFKASPKRWKRHSVD